MSKFLKKSVISLVVIFLVFGASFALAAASPYSGLTEAAKGTVLAQNANPFVFIGGIIKAILSLVGVALVVIIIYAGIMWGFLSANDSKKIQTAKDMIKNAIIGLIIVFAAYGITIFVMNSLTKTGGSSLTPEQREQLDAIPVL